MRSTLILSFLLLLFGCQSETPQTNTPDKPTMKTPNKAMRFDSEVFRSWEKYYSQKDKSFSTDAFELIDSSQISNEQGNVLPVFDKDFDPVYSGFLVYNSKKDKYIDFDSYSWGIDETGEPAFEVDQEVNLVDLKAKSVKRILFYGSTRRVEDAFWVNNEQIVLLESTDDHKPAYSIVDLKNNVVRHFTYTAPFTEETDYFKQRFSKIMKKKP